MREPHVKGPSLGQLKRPGLHELFGPFECVGLREKKFHAPAADESTHMWRLY